MMLVRMIKHVKPIFLTLNKISTPLEVVHPNIWEPTPILIVKGYQYYIHFVDDFTHYTWIFPMKFKNIQMHLFAISKYRGKTI